MCFTFYYLHICPAEIIASDMIDCVLIRPDDSGFALSRVYIYCIAIPAHQDCLVDSFRQLSKININIMKPCQTKQEYLNQVIEPARRVCKRYGYLPSVLIVQECLENGYGMDPACNPLIQVNNMIGQKSELLNKSWTDIGLSVWPGKSITKKTPEQYGKQIVYILRQLPRVRLHRTEPCRLPSVPHVCVQFRPRRSSEVWRRGFIYQGSRDAYSGCGRSWIRHRSDIPDFRDADRSGTQSDEVRRSDQRPDDDPDPAGASEGRDSREQSIGILYEVISMQFWQAHHADRPDHAALCCRPAAGGDDRRLLRPFFRAGILQLRHRC